MISISLIKLEGTKIEEEFNAVSPITFRAFRVLRKLKAIHVDLNRVGQEIGLQRAPLHRSLRALINREFVTDDYRITKCGLLQMQTCTKILENIVWRNLA